MFVGQARRRLYHILLGPTCPSCCCVVVDGVNRPVDMHNQDEVNVCGASAGVDVFARPLGRHTASLDAHGGLGARAGARVGLKGRYAALCEGQFR